MSTVELMKKTVLAFFIVGGWTLILGVVGYFCAFVLIWMGVLPYWPFLVYVIPILGFVVGVLHFRAILRSP